MPQMTIDIPNDLLIAVSNKAQSDNEDFVTTAVNLIRLGLEPKAKDPHADAKGEAMLSKLIKRARTIATGEPFTTQDLAMKAEWDALDPDVRKSVGRGFSKAVREKEMRGVKNTMTKTAQNKNIYIRE